MLKKETYNKAESNIANLGSALEKDVRKGAAEQEKAWAVAGKKPGLQAWRIEKFQVIPNKEAIAGAFYSDDSYIVLNTYKEPDAPKLKWDIHFWLGKTTSQDEMGTAAYKTVELDDFLGTEPVQHREVQGSESSLFLSYWKEAGGIRLLEGGIASGFNHVKPTEYKARLLHLKGKKNVRVTQVDLKASSLNEGDVFILDNGLTIYQFQGKKAGMNEKARGAQLCRTLDTDRSGRSKIITFRQGDKDDDDILEFWKILGGKPTSINAEAGDDEAWEKDSAKSLWHLSDASGTMVFKEVAKGKVLKSLLKSDDVFVFDIGAEVFVWVGKGASDKEKKLALKYAQDYLKDQKRPEHLPICKILEGSENSVFNNSFDRP
jgi:gelsolin